MLERLAGMSETDVRDCLRELVDALLNGNDPFPVLDNWNLTDSSSENDDPGDMDGDLESGLASAGFGMDESYGGWEEIDGSFEHGSDF
jgi:hypothetical protein